jgi:hypothetical protein
MAADTTNLFLLEDLEDSRRTTTLANSDLGALRAVADWIEGFVARPNADLGRPGPVCPFVPGAKDRKTLWLAPEEIADQGVSDVVSLMDDYKRLLLSAQPIEGDEANYKSILVVFTDLSADRARDYADDDQVQGLKRAVLCGRSTRAGRVLCRQRGVGDIQLRLHAIHTTDAIPVGKACGRERLEVLSRRRRLAQHLGASLWRVGSPGPRRGTPPLTVEREARLIQSRARSVPLGSSVRQ